MANKPTIHPDFPIRENLASPTIEQPVPECSEVVDVKGFTPVADFTVYANGTANLGEGRPQ